MNHAFDVAVASKYGVPIAIFLNNIAHWTSVNMANRRNYHDGRYWIYNTRKSFAELFPYWSEDQIRTISKKAKNFDLLLESNYNKHGYDKTIWYSLTDKSLSIYKLFPISPDESDSLNNDENPGPASFGKITKSSPASCGDFTEHQNEQIYEQNDLDEDKTRPEPAPRLIWEKSQMDLGKIPNGSGENPKPIPDVNPDGKTDTTTTIDQILTKDRDSEPVVVFNTSLTSTPTPTPIGRERQEWTEKLSVIYKLKPFTTNIILCEEDFIEAGLWSLDRRGEIHPNGKLKGIRTMVLSGSYEGEPLWISEYQRKKNSLLGDRRKEAIIQHALKKSAEELGIKNAPLVDRTTAIADLMKFASKKKAELDAKDCYAVREHKKYNPPQLPEQPDDMAKNIMWDDESEEQA